MKRKPKGLKYRNLTARGGVIYYERVWKKRRFCFSTKTSSWDEAASVRDLYEQKKGIGTVAFLADEVPTFEDFAERYLKEDTAHLAPTMLKDRKRELAKEGPILPSLGTSKIDMIEAADLRRWWSDEIEGKKRSGRTGRIYLNTISQVFSYARDLGLITSSPVAGFQEVLGRKARSQKGRARLSPGQDVRPIEDPSDIEALSKAAQKEGRSFYLYLLLMLDAGLRRGEALALRWGSILWGDDESDTRRMLIISESRSRGGSPGPTKSGRERKAGLSRRLRRALMEEYRRAFMPGPEIQVLARIDPDNFHKRELRKILKGADIGHRRLKDLRDTFASQLVTAGVQLAYVSKQLGRRTVAVTADHYAHWAGGDEYRAPVQLRPGELPADLLARLKSQGSPKTLLHDANVQVANSLE